MIRQPFLSLLAAGAATIAFTVPACAAQKDEPAAAAGTSEAALRAALSAPTRTPKNVARDQYRHPAETLAFFGVDPGDTVVELWPGGGWYTEVLAPYLSEGGKLYAIPPTGNYTDTITKKVGSDPVYSKVTISSFEAGKPTAVPAGSADVVLTFRNVHNWVMADTPIADAVFAEAFRVLKPGGTLGVVEHRLPEDADSARERQSGYVKTSTVKALAEKAGFRLVEESEINANPKDTKDYPEGVWTLPPNLRLGDKDREKYLAIGESDRMTLKFVKPAG